MYGRNRAEREWMADVAAQMIIDEIMDEEELWGLEALKQGEKVVCDSCEGLGLVENSDGEGFTCENCKGTGLVDEDEE